MLSRRPAAPMWNPTSSIQENLIGLRAYVAYDADVLRLRPGASVLIKLQQTASQEENGWYNFLTTTAKLFTADHAEHLAGTYALISDTPGSQHQLDAWHIARWDCLAYLLHEEPESQRLVLTAESVRLMKLLLPTVQPFDVSRKRLRRWLRSCLSATWYYLRDGNRITGIFTPEMQAAILDAVREYTNFPCDETLEKLRAQIPPTILEPPHCKPRDPNIPANNESQKAHKRILEKIQKARQRIRWSEDRDEWVAEFVTHAALHEEENAKEAEATWRDGCFDLACKEISEFPAPVTKAEVFAAWANKRYSWTDCARWWDQHRRSTVEPRKVDEESRKRIRTQLKAFT